MSSRKTIPLDRPFPAVIARADTSTRKPAMPRLRTLAAAAALVAAGLAAGAGIVTATQSSATSQPRPAGHVSFYQDGTPKIDFTMVNGQLVNGDDPAAILRAADS